MSPLLMRFTGFEVLKVVAQHLLQRLLPTSCQALVVVVRKKSQAHYFFQRHNNMGAVVVVQQNFRGPTTSEWKNTEGIGVAERNGQTFFLVAYKKCASSRNILPPLKRDCSGKSYLESASQQC